MKDRYSNGTPTRAKKRSDLEALGLPSQLADQFAGLGAHERERARHHELCQSLGINPTSKADQGYIQARAALALVCNVIGAGGPLGMGDTFGSGATIRPGIMGEIPTRNSSSGEAWSKAAWDVLVGLIDVGGWPYPEGIIRPEFMWYGPDVDEDGAQMLQGDGAAMLRGSLRFHLTGKDSRADGAWPLKMDVQCGELRGADYCLKEAQISKHFLIALAKLAIARISGELQGQEIAPAIVSDTGLIIKVALCDLPQWIELHEALIGNEPALERYQWPSNDDPSIDPGILDKPGCIRI